MPYLVGIADQTEVTGPLAQFQSKKADKPDTLALLKDINTELSENRLADGVLTETFERWWPDLEGVIRNIPAPQTNPPKRPERELIEEVLERVRMIGREVARPIFRSRSSKLAAEWADLLAALIKADPSISAVETLRRRWNEGRGLHQEEEVLLRRLLDELKSEKDKEEN